ncbi:hypothetical protein K474DRAFT_1651772 [Panus rudis PR-1116 ss-1]|nr:hypothetical protein K474DRAFT_1651772 [Panus rudis PR-1116 ss-1]
MAAYSRSHHSCKLQKLNTIYFKASGVGSKGLDTLNALSITMSQKWAYTGIETLSEAARADMLRMIEIYPWYLAHDNMNLAYKTYEQRLDNQGRFDSGTAGTVFVVKSPAAVRPKVDDMQAAIAVGSKNPITPKDIYKLELKNAPFIRRRAIHRILRILIECPAFNFATYEHRDSDVFVRPPLIEPLPTGPEHATVQFMLDTLDIDEASYEGNDRVIHEFLRQLGLNNTTEKQKILILGDVIVWIGDQLTISRIRGLQRFRSEDLNSYERLSFIAKQFGWLHLQFAYENSLHKQYYSTSFGLSHDFSVLNRKRLNSPSIKGTFHHDFQEGLFHVGEAHLRDIWRIVGKVNDLSELRTRTPEQLKELANTIFARVASEL